MKHETTVKQLIKFVVIANSPNYDLADVKHSVDLAFLNYWNSVQKEVAFNIEWKNGTGYLDGIPNGITETLPEGQVYRCIDNFGRPMIITGTAAGNVVVFARYKQSNGVIVRNTPSYFDSMEIFDSTAMSLADINHYVNTPIFVAHVKVKHIERQKRRAERLALMNDTNLIGDTNLDNNPA
jgi:hypothetical protein